MTSSLAVGRFAAKKGTLRSPRGRLVASLAASKKWMALTTAGMVSLLCFQCFNEQIIMQQVFLPLLQETLLLVPTTKMGWIRNSKEVTDNCGKSTTSIHRRINGFQC